MVIMMYFGDGSVVIISSPGHTAGHQSLFLDLPKTGPIVLSGDLFIAQNHRDDYWVPSFNFSKKDTVYSYAKIEKFLERTKGKLWIQHDLEHFKSLKLAPYAYE